MYSKKIVVVPAVKLDEETEGRLERLAARTGRTKTFYARAAIAAHLNDRSLAPLLDGRRADPVTPRQRSYALFTPLYRSTDRLSRCGASV